jgi:hypothetical protein
MFAMKKARNVLARNWILIPMVFEVLSLREIARADMFPSYTVDGMCDKADAIIEGTYLGKNEVQIDQVYKGSPLLGKHAVPALIQVLRNAPANEKLDPTVIILYDIGPPAALAVPDLHGLLAQPERAYTGYVLSALGSTGDARAIPDLEKSIESDDERLAEVAEEALALHRKRQATMAKDTQNRNSQRWP